jgi:hypothetical protein
VILSFDRLDAFLGLPDLGIRDGFHAFNVGTIDFPDGIHVLSLSAQRHQFFLISDEARFRWAFHGFQYCSSHPFLMSACA